MSEILLAAQIAFRGLHGCMTQQELNLLQFASARVAQFRAGSPQVMRCNVLQSCSLAAGFDDVPHDILRDAFPPYLSRSGNPPKDPSLCDSGCHYPLIDCRLDPLWNGHRADVAALADQVHYCPVTLAHLNLVQLQADQLGSAKATPKQHCQHRVVALRSHVIAARMLQHCGTLLCAQPITGSKTELLDTFHSADSRSQFWTQQACVSGLMGETAHRCKLLVDGVGRQMP